MLAETEIGGRRADDNNNGKLWDAALVMGVGYTIVYAAMLAALIFAHVPDGNGKTLDLLVGAMTVIQTQIVGYFFGSSRNAERSQQLVAASKERTDSTMREIATTAVKNGHK